jgi:O-antigen/teichoic acid export membrane protein
MGGHVASQAIRLGANLLLQRLLVPDVFGVMAVVAVVQQGLAMFSDIGIGPSIIRSPRGEEPAFLRTAWTIQVVRGVALWLAASLLGLILAPALGIPELSTALPVAGFGAVLGGLNSTRLFTRNRRLAMGRLTLVNLVSQMVSIAVLLAWARASPTVWAPVGAGLVAAFMTMVLSHALPGGHRDGLGIDRACLRELLGFGRWVFLSTVLSFLTTQGDRLIFAPLIPIGLLGVYNNASVLATAPTQAVFALGAAVLFPVFSHRFRSAPDAAALRRSFDWTRAPVCVLAALLVSGLIASGPSFVHLLFAKGFREADWMVRLLAIGGLLQVLEGVNGAMLLAMGRSRSVAAYSAAKLAGMMVLIPLAYRAFGFEGAVGALVASEFLKYGASAALAARAGLNVLRLDAALAAWTGASVGMGIAAGIGVDRAGGPLWLRFLVEGAVVTAAWAPAAWWAWTLRRGRATRGPA